MVCLNVHGWCCKLRGYVGQFGQTGLRQGVLSGEGHLRESLYLLLFIISDGWVGLVGLVDLSSPQMLSYHATKFSMSTHSVAAHLLDHHAFSGVPEATLVEVVYLILFEFSFANSCVLLWMSNESLLTLILF